MALSTVLHLLMPTVPAEYDSVQHFLWQMCPVELPTHTHGGTGAYIHAYRYTLTHTITMIISLLIQLSWPDYQCPTKPTHHFLDPIVGSHCHILTFSPIQLIKHSLCFVGKAIPVNGLITDSKLGVFSPAIRQLRLKESLLIETAPHGH